MRQDPLISRYVYRMRDQIWLQVVYLSLAHFLIMAVLQGGSWMCGLLILKLLLSVEDQIAREFSAGRQWILRFKMSNFVQPGFLPLPRA